MRAVFITPEERTIGFEPIMWLRTQEMIQTLEQMGVMVAPVTVNAFSKLFRNNPSDLKKLHGDFIIAANFNYFLLAAVDGTQSLDCLEIPVIALWDDPLGALANFVNKQPETFEKWLNRAVDIYPTEYLRKLARHLTDRVGSARRNFRRIMRHPLLRHFSWDSGHIHAVHSLRLLKSEKVTWYPIATYSAFLSTGLHRKRTSKTRNIGFCGNIYLGPMSESEFFKNEPFRSLTTRICEHKLLSLNRSVWDLMIEEIAALPRAVRNHCGLYVDRKCFWDYYIFMVWHAANTLVRVGLLSKIAGEVSLYGLFADPNSVESLGAYPNLKYEGKADHFEDLPEIYASTKINVCISNGLVYNGMPSKLIDCLASGGFALCDPKEDLTRFFGPVIKQIFFRNTEELNAKIEYFLTHSSERDEIVNELGSKIRQHCTLESLFRQVIDCVTMH